MINLQSVRYAYKSHEISDVGFIRGSYNPAYGLTKPRSAQLCLAFSAQDERILLLVSG